MSDNWELEDLITQLKNNPDLARANASKIPASQDTSQPVNPGAKKPNKHNIAPKENRTYNDRVYPSKKQAQEAESLDLLKRAGKIRGYIEEVPFRLPGHYIDKKGRRKSASHRVDFGILELDNTVTWREVKGRDLALGKLKRKQTEELYHIYIQVV